MTAPGQEDRPSDGAPTYHLGERDPAFIRLTLPVVRLYAQWYHRAEVRGIERMPATGGALLVGNHSGGMMPPDAPVLAGPLFDHFGVERAVFLLSHDIVFWTPFAWMLRKWGMMPASRANTALALRAGHLVFVFPGGDYDAFRPSWHSAKIDFGGRRGFVDAALAENVPIVPVVSIGGQETQLFLTRGESLARWSPFGSIVRSRLCPITAGFPLPLSVAGVNLPLPAKITTEVLAPIDLRRAFGARPDRDAIYEHVSRVMQEALDRLALERRFPILG
ncbi:MAG: acyltransferase family protein [Deltaproteobacteria bacterium]|nr:acyltransferase family protein [Deltaproteobacteria bacterium]